MTPGERVLAMFETTREARKSISVREIGPGRESARSADRAGRRPSRPV